MIGKDRKIFKGFTLAELLIASSIFILAFFLAASIIGIINKQEVRLRAVQELNLEATSLMLKLEQIIKNSKIQNIEVKNINLIDKQGKEIDIKWLGDNIVLEKDGKTYNLNSNKIKITWLTFFYFGNEINGENMGNRVVMIAFGAAPSYGIYKDKISTNFQTTMTSRRYAY